MDTELETATHNVDSLVSGMELQLGDLTESLARLYSEFDDLRTAIEYERMQHEIEGRS